MGKCKTTTKGGASSQRGASSFLSSQDWEEGDTIQDLIGEVPSMEEVLWHLGASHQNALQIQMNQLIAF